MEKSLTTKNTALAALSADEQAAIQADRKKMGNTFPSVPMIRLSNKDMTQAPEGEYFIERRNGDESEVTPIGKEPAITILYRTYTYSYFTKADGLIAWTSDIHGFTQMDDVTLFVRKGDKIEIAFEGDYRSFKTFMDEKYTTSDPVTGKKQKLLKFKTVLYVEYEGEVYKMFVSNASNAGVDLEGNPSFDNPQPKSLQTFMDSCWKQKRVSYEFKLVLGSAYVETSKPFYIMTFAVLSENDVDSLKRAIAKSRDVQKSIMVLDAARKNVKPEAAQTVVKPGINPEDLPF